MAYRINLIVLFVVLCSCNNKTQPTHELSSEIDKIGKYLKVSVDTFYKVRNDSLISPRSVEDNKVKMVKAKDWTSGFFPGELWMMYDLTGNEYWKQIALEFTTPLENEKWNGKTHDMGFKMYCSFGKAWEHTNNPKFSDILVQSAETLASRFKTNIGCIRSWDFNADTWDFPVIMDNMMNLELLFWAAKTTGNEQYKHIAISHAEKTMLNHFRDDYSSYHVVDYNPQTGEAQAKCTHQGYADESSWSRGQAWALYGFTMVYRETKDKKFLEQAENIAAYILNNPSMPANLIPYWDFNAPNIPNEPLDASAAAVIGSALFELSTFSNNSKIYLDAANSILNELLSDSFLADPTANHGFLLMHSTGSKPHNSEIDKPLIYADYYLLEMIIRKRNLLLNN